MLTWQIASRAEFDRLASVDPGTLTDLERAARFLYLQRLTFGGKVTARSFGVATGHRARFETGRLTPLLEAAHERLSGVYVERLPWREFLARWDRPETLFYCDPPYWGVERYYGKGCFPPEDFEELARTLRGLKGRFVLTLNDVPEVRRLFSFARIEEATLNYWVGGGAPKRARELIISGGAGHGAAR
jgi:DNA adenine methylase